MGLLVQQQVRHQGHLLQQHYEQAWEVCRTWQVAVVVRAGWVHQTGIKAMHAAQQHAAAVL
jgi:hypothetical protein